MEFAKEEINYLKNNHWVYYSNNYFTRKSSHDDGSDHYSLKKDEVGNIIYWAMYPTNVDCDSGKCDMETVTRKYKTFMDFKNNNHYCEDISIK